MRVSLGYHSTAADCATFLRFLTEEFLNRAPEPMPVFAPFGAENESFDTALLRSPMDPNSLFLTPSPLGDLDCNCNARECGSGEGVPRPIKLAAIYVYPIKSCAGNASYILFLLLC